MRRFPLVLVFCALLLAACHHRNPLTTPKPAGLDAAAPDSFVVRVTTTKGPFEVAVHRDWSPKGADRLFFLVSHRFYDGARFFRAVPNFIVQFGVPADTLVSRTWASRRIADDSVRRENVRGTISFASGGPNTRTTQLFINLKDNKRLDPLGFIVVAEVVAGMSVVDSLYQGYGEAAPRGKGPNQARIAKEGEGYLARDFPLLDKIVEARVVQRWSGDR